MKNQIITFIIGVLVGAIITTTIFLIFKPNSSRKVLNFSGTNRSGERVRPNSKKDKRNRENITDNNTKVDENKDKINEIH